MDSSFVAIGETLTVSNALNPGLSYLLDANQQVFELDSDSEPRLIYLKISRGNINSGWDCSIENNTLEEVAAYYDKDSETYDPPRVVDAEGNVVGPRKPNSVTSQPPFASLGIINIKGSINPWQVEANPPFAFANVMYDWTVQSFPYFPRFNNLMMTGEQRYRMHTVAEVGTYVIPICYHRTTEAGFESIQVLRSDASFWPMPNHQVWSIQDNWQHMYRTEWSDVVPPINLNYQEGYENNGTPDILSPPKGTP